MFTQVAVSSFERDSQWNLLPHLSTYPFPLFLSTLLRPPELVTVLDGLSISLLSLCSGLEMISLVAVLLSLSDHISVPPVPGGIEFSSIPTIKLL